MNDPVAAGYSQEEINMTLDFMVSVYEQYFYKHFTVILEQFLLLNL